MPVFEVYSGAKAFCLRKYLRKKEAHFSAIANKDAFNQHLTCHLAAQLQCQIQSNASSRRNGPMKHGEMFRGQVDRVK